MLDTSKLINLASLLDSVRNAKFKFDDNDKPKKIIFNELDVSTLTIKQKQKILNKFNHLIAPILREIEIDIVKKIINEVEKEK